MLTGFNENVEYNGLTYHVQTEDVRERHEVVSHVFYDGRVLHTYRASYADQVGAAGWADRLAETMRRQHSLMVAAVVRGRFGTGQ